MAEYMDSSMPWVKVHTELLDNHKLYKLSIEVRWRYIEFLILAGKLDSEGYFIEGDSVMSVEDIAWRLRADEKSVEESLEKLEEIGEVTYDEKFGWLLVNFSIMQGRPQSEKRERWKQNKRNYRMKNQAQSRVDVSNESSTTNESVSNELSMTNESVSNESSMTNESVSNESSMTNESVSNELSMTNANVLEVSSISPQGVLTLEKEKEEEKEAEKEGEKAAAAAVFKSYESNIEPLSPLVRDKLIELLENYPPGWIIDAISEAVDHNARKMAYIRGILVSWKANGKGRAGPKTPNISRDDKSPYTSGTLSSWVNH